MNFKMQKQFLHSIEKARNILIFTGAGISADSGIPTFRDKNGIWTLYDADFLEIGYFKTHPAQSWQRLIEVFYTITNKAEPNAAHFYLAGLEKEKALLIATQNIDSLHQRAGSHAVAELHGTLAVLRCLNCGYTVKANRQILAQPHCPHCRFYLKPDIVFFGEELPSAAWHKTIKYAEMCDLCIIIGTSGEVHPAATIPFVAKHSGAEIIEINPSTSAFTTSLTDIYIKEKAGSFFSRLLQ
jgi:NAD-dependent deacetylase